MSTNNNWFLVNSYQSNNEYDENISKCLYKLLVYLILLCSSIVCNKPNYFKLRKRQKIEPTCIITELYYISTAKTKSCNTLVYDWGRIILSPNSWSFGFYHKHFHSEIRYIKLYLKIYLEVKFIYSYMYTYRVGGQ